MTFPFGGTFAIRLNNLLLHINLCWFDFSFELVLGPLIEYKPTGDKEHDIQTICQMCTTALEKMIAEQPEQWMWAHRRWTNINRDHHRKRR